MGKNTTFYLLFILIGINSCKQQPVKYQPEYTPHEYEVEATDSSYPVDTTSGGTANLTGQGQRNLEDTVLSNHAELLGTYSGYYGNNSILSITLRYLGSKNAVGFNVVKGVKRNINGNYSITDNIATFEMKEPGDQLNDGIFSFTIDTTTGILKGTWKPYIDSISALKSYQLKQPSKEIDSIFPSLEYDDGAYYIYNLNNRPVEEDNNYELDLHNDGLFMFLYYANYKNDKDQRKKINGSWAIIDDSLMLDMPINDFFKTTRKKLHIKNSEDYDLELDAADMRFYYQFSP